MKKVGPPQKLILEALEERKLFSGGLEGVLDLQNTPDQPALYQSIDQSVDQSTESETGQQQTVAIVSKEIVFVDQSVDNYELLLSDIYGQEDDARQIDVVVLDRDRSGVDQISQYLEGQEGVDAIHIIAHGSDGNIDIGNASFNAVALAENRLDVALWANAFSSRGDILIYGCDLADSDAGKTLIDDLAALTLTDVAASDDLTGHALLGGDWDLEYQVGQIETEIAISEQVQSRYHGVLAQTTLEAFEPTVAEMTDLANEVSSTQSAGQTFSHNSGNGTYQADQIELVLYKLADAPSQTITVTLRDAFNGNVLGSTTMSSDLLSTTEAWHSFDIGSVTLNDGQTYTIQVESDGVDKVFHGC